VLLDELLVILMSVQLKTQLRGDVRLRPLLVLYGERRRGLHPLVHDHVVWTEPHVVPSHGLRVCLFQTAHSGVAPQDLHV